MNNQRLVSEGKAVDPYSIGQYFDDFFTGAFGTPKVVWGLFHETAILLLVALAVTPCFKMKFWNIGGEGQILMGGLGAAVAIQFMSGKASNASTIIVSIILAIAFGVVWAVIPALFKAKWNTNETLLTLMMNYIAICLVDFFISSVAVRNQTGKLNFLNWPGTVPPIGPADFAGRTYILKIVIVAVITTIIAIYMKYSKHGYEISVVGESPNTAKYVGINTKAVIIRTLVLCGVMCGICGFLLVSATSQTLNTESTVGGRGFVGVLISWLAQFNPIFMVLVSFLVVFIQKGSAGVALWQDGFNATSYSSVMTGIFFFLIIAVEFFVNYKLIFRSDIQAKIDNFNGKIKFAFTKKKNAEGSAILQDTNGEEQVEEAQPQIVEIESPASDETEAKEEE
ncbi:MAG: ABC transporter permease [Clostridia bacterium]|nr:ABC transporter permease [Clostridia bacterium]